MRVSARPAATGGHLQWAARARTAVAPMQGEPCRPDCGFVMIGVGLTGTLFGLVGLPSHAARSARTAGHCILAPPGNPHTQCPRPKAPPTSTSCVHHTGGGHVRRQPALAIVGVVQHPIRCLPSDLPAPFHGTDDVTFQ